MALSLSNNSTQDKVMETFLLFCQDNLLTALMDVTTLGAVVVSMPSCMHVATITCGHTWSHDMWTHVVMSTRTQECLSLCMSDSMDACMKDLIGTPWLMLQCDIRKSIHCYNHIRIWFTRYYLQLVVWL